MTYDSGAAKLASGKISFLLFIRYKNHATNQQRRSDLHQRQLAHTPWRLTMDLRATTVQDLQAFLTESIKDTSKARPTVLGTIEKGR